VKDTVYVQNTLLVPVVRTDKYVGMDSLDCAGGCPIVVDTAATVEVTYYPNDSTRFKLSAQSGILPSQRATFVFSVVGGKVSGWDDLVSRLFIYGGDSLAFSGSERPNRGLSTLLFSFRGRRKR
jgi:hypothetical protein